MVPSLAADEEGDNKVPLPISLRRSPFPRAVGPDFWRSSPCSGAPAPDSHGGCAQRPASAARPP